MADEIDEQPAELVIEIDPPIVMKGGTYDSITLREPKVIEVRQAENHLRTNVNMETMRRFQVALVAKVAGVDEPVIEGLPISKLNQAVTYLQNFISSGQPTSKN